MKRFVRKYPKYGDIFFIEDGKMRFVQGADITNGQADSLQAVGVVYDVHGKLFDVVAGQNTVTQPWSIACDFEITAIPSDSGDLEVKLQNTVVGTFTYTKTEGTKGEFVTQLNVWLETNAPKWEAYMENETTAILQMSTYDSYENTCTITGCTLVKRVGSELAAETISWGRNSVLQRTVYNGCCRARLGEWAPSQTSSNNNPTTRMNGTTQLFATFPCSESYYNGELGDGLRENFPTYEAYLDACMVRPVEMREGIMRYTSGKPLADKLLGKKLLVRGVEKDAYPGAVWADRFDCGVPGYGAGTFYQPSESEISRLMRGITLGTKQPLDAINVSLGKRTGWTQIPGSSSRWSCCRCTPATLGTSAATGFAPTATSAFGLRCLPLPASVLVRNYLLSLRPGLIPGASSVRVHPDGLRQQNM
ncbi:MAG: hypothetical protein ACI30I_08975 [Parabacteroides sp.]